MLKKQFSHIGCSPEPFWTSPGRAACKNATGIDISLTCQLPRENSGQCRIVLTCERCSKQIRAFAVNKWSSCVLHSAHTNQVTPKRTKSISSSVNVSKADNFLLYDTSQVKCGKFPTWLPPKCPKSKKSVLQFWWEEFKYFYFAIIIINNNNYYSNSTVWSKYGHFWFQKKQN